MIETFMQIISINYACLIFSVCELICRLINRFFIHFVQIVYRLFLCKVFPAKETLARTEVFEIARAV